MGYNYNKSALTLLPVLTSANGVARESSIVNITDTTKGTISFACSCALVTPSVTATFKLQVSDDTVTWYDVKAPNNASNVALTASGAVALPLAGEYAGWGFVRAVATLAGAATAVGDTTTVGVRYVPFGMLPTGY